MKTTERHLRKIIREVLSERIAPHMGPGKGRMASHIDDRTGEVLVAVEDELGTSNLLDAVLQKLDSKQMKRIIFDVAKQYNVDVGHKQF